MRDEQAESAEVRVTNGTTALKPKVESFDDVLPLVGDFGKYQWFLMLAIFPYSVIYALLYFSQIFLTLVPTNHWCRVEELANLTVDQRVKLAIPLSEDHTSYDTCRYKDLEYGKLLADGVDFRSPAWQTNKTIQCREWEYNFTQIPYASIAAELDWVCDQEYLISTAQSIFFCGAIVGSLAYGWVADHKGRVPALAICTGIGLVATVATASANSFWSFALCRFLTGTSFDSCVYIPLIITIEYIGVKRRSLVINIAFGLYFAFASTALPWMAYFIANWRYFAYATAIPFLSFFVTPWILPESARWYISNQQMDKVVEKLQRIAKVNGKKPDRQIYETFVRNLGDVNQKKDDANLTDLFKTPRLTKHAILLILSWFLILVAFDGHVYSVKLLKESVFVSFSLACATELPAGFLLALVLDRWGRRFCGFITMALTGVFSFAELILGSDVGQLTMSVLSRFCLNMAANVSIQYAAEVLPTAVRAQGVSLIHIFGFAGHSIAPYIVDMRNIWSGMPMAILGVISFVAALLTLFLPETAGQDLPQTLQEGEDFGKDQHFWEVPCWKKKNSGSIDIDVSVHGYSRDAYTEK